MWLATVSLESAETPQRQHMNVPLLVDLMWLATRPGDQVEHISARVEPTGLAAGFFFAGRETNAAHDRLERICRRALNSSPLFHGWTARVGGGRPESPRRQLLGTDIMSRTGI